MEYLAYFAIGFLTYFVAGRYAKVTPDCRNVMTDAEYQRNLLRPHILNLESGVSTDEAIRTLCSALRDLGAEEVVQAFVDNTRGAKQ